MDDLLEEMYQAQRGEAALTSPQEAQEEEEEEEDEDDDWQAPTSSHSTSSTSSTSSSIWRPDVKPPQQALCHARARRKRRPPPPDLQLEVLRHNAVGSLTCWFLNKTNRDLAMDLRVVPFERWLFSQHRVDGMGDPILPDPRSEEGQAKAGRSLLRRELIEAGAGKLDAQRVVEQLGKTAVKLLGQLQRAAATMPPPPTTLLDARHLPLIQVRFDAGRRQYQLVHKATTMSLNQKHYDKLQALYARFGTPHLDMEGEETRQKRLHYHVFVLLLRYSSLAGGTARGGGFQGAINEEAFDVLLRRFDCRMECFASPLNCRYAHYCSAFEDTDWYFGSLGSFFNFRPRQGMYEANPPFLPCMMDRMGKHMEALLEASNEPLGFIIIIPAWEEEADKTEEETAASTTTRTLKKKGSSTPPPPTSAKKPKAIQHASGASWRRLRESTFCARHVLLKAQDHGYVEGSQHKLPTRFKTSFFDTSVFFLQNEAARAKWPVTDAIVAELQRACGSKHEEETRQRREGGLDLMVKGGTEEEDEEEADAEKEERAQAVHVAERETETETETPPMATKRPVVDDGSDTREHRKKPKHSTSSEQGVQKHKKKKKKKDKKKAMKQDVHR